MLLLVCFLSATLSHSQISVTCPSNIVVGTDSNTCSAVVTYDPPAVTSDSSISTTFSYTGAQQFYVVPANVSEVFVEAWGAQGMTNGNTSDSVAGGLGGYAYGTLSVSPGDTYMYSSVTEAMPQPLAVGMAAAMQARLAAPPPSAAGAAALLMSGLETPP